MAKNLTAAQIAEKQVRRAQAALQDYKDGVAGVKESPTIKAAEAVDRWIDGLQRAHADGSFVDGCRAVTKQEWVDKTVTKGGKNYVPGIQAAQPTIEAFQAQSKQNQESINAILNTMPRGDLEQNIQRMNTQIREKAKFKFRKRRS